MKLNNWRNRSYPIQLLVDGKKVYQGKTPTSLGYVTITFEPTTGTNLTVALQGASIDKDSFNITELNAEKEKSDPIAARPTNTLAILEIEVYQNVSN